MPPRFEDRAALRSGGSGPDGSDDDTSQTSISGERVRLRCEVHAVPSPQITWYRNGVELRRLDGTGDKHLLSRDGRELVITDAGVLDTARYTCVARNLAGETERNFDVTVHGLILTSFYNDRRFLRTVD